VAGADLVTSLRQAGVSRGDLVALVISPALELGLAAGTSSWTVPGVAAEIGRADEELRPRWVLWSGQTAARLADAGVRLATCWDIAAVHRLLFGGWRADPGWAWARLRGLATDTMPADGPARPVRYGRGRHRRPGGAGRAPAPGVGQRRLVG